MSMMAIYTLQYWKGRYEATQTDEEKVEVANAFFGKEAPIILRQLIDDQTSKED